MRSLAIVVLVVSAGCSVLFSGSDDEIDAGVDGAAPQADAAIAPNDLVPYNCTPDVIALYRFEGDLTSACLDPLANYTLIGGVETYRPSQPGLGMGVDIDATRLAGSVVNSLAVTGGMGVDFWFSAKGQNTHLFVLGNTVSTDEVFRIVYDAALGVRLIAAAPGCGSETIATSALPDNIGDWFHVSARIAPGAATVSVMGSAPQTVELEDLCQGGDSRIFLGGSQDPPIVGHVLLDEVRVSRGALPLHEFP